MRLFKQRVTVFTACFFSLLLINQVQAAPQSPVFQIAQSESLSEKELLLRLKDHLNSGEHSQANKTLRALIQLDPQNKTRTRTLVFDMLKHPYNQIGQGPRPDNFQSVTQFEINWLNFLLGEEISDGAVYYELADRYYNDQHYTEAIEPARKATATKPEAFVQLQLYGILGGAYANLGEIKTAHQYTAQIETLAIALLKKPGSKKEIFSKSIRALTILGVFIDDKLTGYQAINDRLDQARFLLADQAIQLDAKLDQAYQERGLQYAHRKKYPEAFADLQKAIHLNPHNPEHYGKRAFIYELLGLGNSKNRTQQFKLSIQDYSTAIALLEKKPQSQLKHTSENWNLQYTYSQRGLVYSFMNRCKEALKDYQKACQLGSTYNCSKTCKAAGQT